MGKLNFVKTKSSAHQKGKLQTRRKKYNNI